MSKRKPDLDNPHEFESRDGDEDVTHLKTKFESDTGAEDDEGELKLPGYQVLRRLGSGQE